MTKVCPRLKKKKKEKKEKKHQKEIDKLANYVTFRHGVLFFKNTIGDPPDFEYTYT